MKNKNPKNTFAAMTGGALGAGVAIAGAVVMKDKKNQDKIKKVFIDVKNQATNYMGKIGKEIKKDKKIIKKKVVAAKKTLKNSEKY
jgi:molybdopterin biosynthesis enzyme